VRQEQEEPAGYTEGGETARRALRLIELVVTAGAPVALGELVELAGLSKSTCYRLVRVLQDERYLDRAESGGYSIGSRLVGIAAAVLPQAAVYQAARPSLWALADAVGETATLHVRSGSRSVLVLGVESSEQVLRRAATIGETAWLGRGASGHAILAHLAPADAERIINQADDPDSLRHAMAVVAEDGYALSYGANHPGVHGIAAPVLAAFTAGGGMSVAVSGPADRWTEDRMRACAPQLLKTCEELSILFADMAEPAAGR
jgi:IclR family transcriptional regulator, acetate operon repressor